MRNGRSRARGRSGERSFTAPGETALLTAKQLAEWMQVSGRQVDRIKDVPYVELGGNRSRRYLVKTVLAYLEARATKAAT